MSEANDPAELAALRAALDADRAALANERAALAAERRQLDADRARFESEKLAAAESARLAARRSATAPAATSTPAPAARRRPTAPTWRELDSGAYLCVVGDAVTRGEHQLQRRAWPHGWLIVAGLEVSDRTRSREVDLLVIAPQGLVVIEQKDTAARGTLRFDANGAPTADGVAVPSLSGALRQARLPAQMLGAGLRDAGVRGGYVGALLALRGPKRVEPDQVGATQLCRADDVVAATARLLGPDDPEQALPVGTVLTLLTKLGLPLGGLPALQECGFPDSSW